MTSARQVLLALVLLSNTAQAQPQAAAVRAQKLLDDCNDLLDRKSCTAARSACADAYAVVPQSNILLNLALAYECLGQRAVASILIEQFLRDPGKSSPSQLTQAREKLRILRAQSTTLGQTKDVKQGRAPDAWNPSRSAAQQAQRLLDRCNALIDEKRYAEAEPLCRDTYAIFPQHNLMLILATVSEGRGRIEEAISLLEQFVANPGSNRAAMVEAAAARLTMLRTKLPQRVRRLHRRIEWSPSDARVFLDDEPLRAAGALELDIKEGEHRLSVIPPPQSVFEAKMFPFTVAAGQPEQLRFALPMYATRLRVIVPWSWTVLIDGVAYPGANTGTHVVVTAPLEAGIHGVVARAPSGRWIRREVNLPWRQELTVDLRPTSIGRALAPPLTIGGLGLLSIGAGLILMLKFPVVPHLDGSCQPPMEGPFECPFNLELTKPGAALLGSGIGLAVGAGIWLGVTLHRRMGMR